MATPTLWTPETLAQFCEATGPIAQEVFGEVRSGRTRLVCVVPTPEISESMDSHHCPAKALRGHIHISMSCENSHVIQLLKTRSYLVFIPPKIADELQSKMDPLDMDRRVSWYANVIWNGLKTVEDLKGGA